MLMMFYGEQLGFRLYILLLLFINSFCLCAQTIVKGKVLDATQNVPLQGVTIQLRGQKSQATSVSDGSYSITIPSGQMTGSLVFTHVGYTPVTIPLNNRTTIDVQLFSDGKELETIIMDLKKELYHSLNRN
jgi:predicted MFS family arabinose efflux permease